MNFKKETGIRWPTVSAKVFVVSTSHHIASFFKFFSAAKIQNPQLPYVTKIVT